MPRTYEAMAGSGGVWPSWLQFDPAQAPEEVGSCLWIVQSILGSLDVSTCPMYLTYIYTHVYIYNINIYIYIYMYTHTRVYVYVYIYINILYYILTQSIQTFMHTHTHISRRCCASSYVLRIEKSAW